MIRLLFVITSFRHGGTNKSLQNLLSLIDNNRYSIEIYAMEHYGPYENMFLNCTILPEDKWLSSLISNYKDKKGVAKVRSLFIKVIRELCLKVNCNLTNIIFKKGATRLNKENKYDAVIAYSEGVPTVFVSYLLHPNKIAWIHCDYRSYKNLNNQIDETKIYRDYKSIVCVSEYTKKEFCSIFPFYKKKTFSLYNLVNVNYIYNKANTNQYDERFITDQFTIISIGTFYPIKRLSMIPDIAIELLKKGCRFKWYSIGSIGDVKEFRLFQNKIKKYGLTDCVIHLGEKKNPYFYLKNSDLFVSLSITEACPYVINEAKVLHIPIVCTDFPAAPEFVEDNKIGYIAAIDNIVNKIDILINDSTLYQKIKDNIEKCSYNNDELINKFYTILGKEYD